MSRGSRIGVRTYYKRVCGRALRDAWRLVGTHLWFAAAVLVVTYGIGVLLGTKLDGETLTGFLLIPLAALGCVALVVFAVALVRSPVLLDRDATAHAAQQFEPVSRQLAAANDRLASVESESVSEAHRVALQGFAGALLRVVERRTNARYVQAEPPELEAAFREHFAAIASEVDRWNMAISSLEEARDGLRAWLKNAVQERGLDASPYQAVSAHVGREAETTAPEMQFVTVAGHLQAHGELIMDLTMIREQEREQRVQGLRDLLRDAVATDERAKVIGELLVVQRLQEPLTQSLKALQAKAVIRGKCSLCR
jgi:hypothetical protein